MLGSYDAETTDYDIQGRVISQRRTRTEWELLIAMHRGWYPLVDRQVYRRMGPAPRDRACPGRHRARAPRDPATRPPRRSRERALPARRRR